jgi:hypothetical protein
MPSGDESFKRIQSKFRFLFILALIVRNLLGGLLFID